jgi:hypothetical protein
MSEDRTVHAVTAGGGEIVRYDRAGKWYHEHAGDPRERRAVTFAEAVRIATLPDSTVRRGLPGGARFDKATSR